jgi:hypothetical protein
LQTRTLRALALFAVLAGAALSPRRAEAQVAGNVTLGAPLVFDPKLTNPDGSAAQASISWNLTTSDGVNYDYTASLFVTDQNGNTLRTFQLAACTANNASTATWDGTDDTGALMAPGAYLIQLSAQGDATGSGSQPINVVRLGARSVGFTGNGRVSMTYHASNGSARSYFAVDSAGDAWNLPASVSPGALDDASGNALVGPAPWLNVAAPPTDSNGVVLAQGRSFPVCYVGGSTPSLTLTLGDSAVVGGQQAAASYPIQGTPIRVNVGGAPSGEIVPGAQVTVSLGAALPSGLGKTTLNVQVGFEYFDGASWNAIAGGQTLQVTVYTVLDTNKLSSSGGVATDAQELPFVAAVDEVAGWASGAQVADNGSALTLITRNVNGSLGLHYDTTSGASAYTDGGALEAPDFAFSDFLTGFARGQTVNCSDCADIVTTFARSIGVDMKVTILGSDFHLNFIRGIGIKTWTRDVFGPGGDSFSYHAVCTTNDGKTIWDACLDVDDGPKPHEQETRIETLPLDMPFAHYHQKLSPDPFSITGLGRATQH